MINNLDLENISNRIRTIIEDFGLQFYDLHYNKVSKTLRVFIDRERGEVTVNDCKQVSNLISKELETSDSFDLSYTLEVSSPGVERPLKRPEHYSRVLGKLVEIDLGDRKVTGYLRNAQPDAITVATPAGENLIPYASILKAKVVEETLYGKRR